MWKRYVYNETTTNYLISDDGQVYSEISKKLLSPYKNHGGYLNVHLFINGKEVKKGVHNLVAEMFIPNPDNKPTVNHKDGNKENNRHWNLEWATQSENNIHAVKTGLRKPASGSKVHFAKYTEAQVRAACKKMASDSMSLKEIETLTGIPAKTLSEIRSGKIWKDVSKDFKFPKNPEKGSRIGLDHKTKKKIKRLVKAGWSNKEIYNEIGMKRTKQLENMISNTRFKWKLSMVMDKDQRPSNAQQPCEENTWIDDELVYAWELEASRVAPQANGGPV